MYAKLKVHHTPIEGDRELIERLARTFAVAMANVEKDKIEALKSSDFSPETWDFVLYGHKSADRSIIFCRQSEDELHVTSYPLRTDVYDVARHTLNCTRSALRAKSPEILNPITIEDSLGSTVAKGNYGRLKGLGDPARWTSVAAALVAALLIIFGKSEVWDQVLIFLSGAVSAAALMYSVMHKDIKWGSP